MTDKKISYTDLTYRVAIGLQALRETQAQVSAHVEGAITPDSPTKEQLQLYSLSLIREVTEWLDTLNWKPWKTDKELSFKRTTDEFADILAFLGLLTVYMLNLGITPTDLADAYVNKTAENLARFNGERPGYEVNAKETSSE